MLVLAASQSDAVALEDNALRRGLLTQTLVQEGLEGSKADVNQSGGTTPAEWPAYAETRVPALAEAVARGESIGGARAVDTRGRREAELVGEAPAPARIAQQPRLFAVKGAGSVGGGAGP